MQRSACFYSTSVEVSVIIVFWKAYLVSRGIVGFLVKSFLVCIYICTVYTLLYLCMYRRQGKE